VIQFFLNVKERTGNGAGPGDGGASASVRG
jgi:hypothetical protein